MTKTLPSVFAILLAAIASADVPITGVVNIYIARAYVTLGEDQFRCLSELAPRIDKFDRRLTINVNTVAEGLDVEAAKVAALFRTFGFDDVNVASSPGSYVFYPPGGHKPELRMCNSKPI
jgi:hypothetical protein